MFEPELYLGDCLSVMADLPDRSVDMVLCDLPYGTTRNKWDIIIPLDKLWLEYNRICKPTAIVALTASQPFSSVLVMSNLANFRHEWVWIKNRGSNFANTIREPMKEHESVLIFSHGKWTYNKQMQTRTGGGLAMIGAVKKNKGGATACYGSFAGRDIRLTELRVPASHQKFNTEVGLHPTQKPVALFEYLIRTYSNEGDVVLDNTMGSGTSGVACANTNRRFIGIEKDLEYFSIAYERMKVLR